MSFLRREAGEAILVTRGPEEVGVDPAHLRCDVLAFHEALEKGDWAGALELYQGDLLEGLHVKGAPEFLDWVDRERTRLRETAAAAAWKRAHGLVDAGSLVEAERTAQQALELVATDESPVREFLEALARAGDRGAALRFYEKFKGVLAAELEAEPAPETAAVAEAVRRGEIGARQPPRPQPPGGVAASAAAVPAARAARWPWERVILGGVALAVLVAGGVALGRWLRPGTPEPGGSSPPARTAIAVLPLQTVAVIPDDWRVHAARGLALAGLGRRQEAQREARWVGESEIYRNDAWDGVDPAEHRALILAGIGETDGALEEIERLLAGPSMRSAHTFRLDPGWDPIRDNPRFQALLEKYAVPGPAG